MNSLLLSRITKDYLNLDPEVVSPKERYRLGWGGSVLIPHNSARPRTRREKVLQLLQARERWSHFFRSPREIVLSLSTSPKLPPPKPLPNGSFSLPRYFSKGGLDKKEVEAISYLLTETSEWSKARPVPGNTQIFRALCRGKGVIKRGKQGMIYLDIDNLFITMMFPYLQKVGLMRPPYFNLFNSPEGAHIPLILPREVAFHYLNEIEGIGKEISFEIEGLYSMKPDSWPEVEEVWFFKVTSPELEDFRRRHLLPPLPMGHSFHIAIAVRAHLGSSKRAQPLMRINIAYLAA